MSSVGGEARKCPGLASPEEMSRWDIIMHYGRRQFQILGSEWKPIECTPSGHPSIKICQEPELPPSVYPPEILLAAAAGRDESDTESDSNDSGPGDLVSESGSEPSALCVSDVDEDLLQESTSEGEEDDLQAFGRLSAKQVPELRITEETLRATKTQSDS